MRALPTVRFVLAAFGLLGLAHLAQRPVDGERFALDLRRDSYLVPDPAMMRAAALGQPSLLGDLLWVRVALNFADLVDHPDEKGSQWLRALIRSVTRLDPGWRTVYFYGGSMMRVLGDIDGSDEVFSLGREALPEDPYFPFSLGMNALLYRDDAVQAARWLAIAAELPGAPPWYKAASAGFIHREGQLDAALAYLREEIEQEREPSAREPLERRYRSLLHEKLAAQLTEAWQALPATSRAASGLGALGPLPPDPLGGAWIVGADGEVRSDVDEALRRERAIAEERAMLVQRR